ncbi:MAG: trehalose 6-phosphate phosphatase [Maricaulis maris]|jgi:trehalose 6-phosphate phosphatase
MIGLPTHPRSRSAQSHPPPEALDPRRDALFLDFDGTLAPLQDDPDTVQLPHGGAALLERLAAALGGALAIVSGRDIRDLDRRTPGALWRAGGHGCDVCAPGRHPVAYAASAPDALFRAATALVTAAPGSRLESKGRVLAIHYRAAPAAEGQLAEGLAGLVADHPGYHLQSGKMVFELKPESASKARAVERLMRLPPFSGRRPVMIGDDATDEDGMRAAIGLGGHAIKVGPGDSLAATRLNDPAHVWTWLEASTP